MDGNRTLCWSALIALGAASLAAMPRQADQERDELRIADARAAALEYRQTLASEQAEAALSLCDKEFEAYKVAIKRVRHLTVAEAEELVRLKDRIAVLEKRVGPCGAEACR